MLHFGSPDLLVLLLVDKQASYWLSTISLFLDKKHVCRPIQVRARGPSGGGGEGQEEGRGGEEGLGMHGFA